MTTDPTMDPLDDSLKRAMKALDDQASDRYFDELPDRTLARLEEQMQSDGDRPVSQVPTPVAAQPARAPSASMSTRSGEAAKPVPQVSTERVEDSGLHDIRALASSTKTRVSRRRATQNPPFDDAVIQASSANLRAVALPEPGKMVQTGEHPVIVGSDTGQAASLLGETAAAAATPITPLASRTKAPVIVGSIFVAAAAGVAGFFVLQERQDQAAAPASAALTESSRPGDVGAARLAAPEAPAGAPVAGIALETARLATASGDDDPAAEPAERKDVEAKPGGKDRNRQRTDKTDRTDTENVKADDAKPDVKPDKKDDKKDDKKGPADKQDQTLDDLLREAGVDPNAKKKNDRPKIDKKSLDATDIRRSMSALNGKAQACYAKHGVSGSVGVKLMVDPSGEIKKATVTGAAAGTPTGDCVAGIVGHAKFPVWDGAPQTVTYSYFLSE